MRKGLGRVAGQACDDVHIDLAEAGLPRLVEGAQHIGRRVLSADRREHAVLHGLRIDADAADAGAFQHAQLFRRDGVRAAGLDRIFAQRRQVEAVRERSGQPFELLRGQRRRRTAADIDTLHALSGLPDERRRLAYLTAQRFEIRLDKRARLRGRRGNERAVVASRRAERDADIERNIIRADFLIQLHRGRGRADGERSSLGRNMEAAAQDLRRLAARFPPLDQTARELCRAHAGEAAPDRRLLEKRYDRVIDGRLDGCADGALARKLIQPLRQDGNASCMRLAADRHAGGRAQAAVPLGERGYADVAVLLGLDARQRLSRQQVQQHLLRCVLHLMSFQYVFHRPLACSI